MATEALPLRTTPSSPTTLIAAPTRVSSQRPRVDLAGVLIDRVDLTLAADKLREFAHAGVPHQVVTVNLDFMSIAERHAQFRATINSADLAVADGMPLVWVSHFKGDALPERVAGVDLVDECCRIAVAEGRGVFLLGAAPGVAQAAADKLKARAPGLRVDAYSPPFGPMSADEDERIVRMIQAARPSFLFVALGAPRQDLWIREHLDRLDVPVAMGVGCTFDVLAGVTRRAPGWMRRGGLEWAYRLAQEPGRLWRRYILNDFPTLARLFLGGSSPTVEGTPIRSAPSGAEGI